MKRIIDCSYKYNFKYIFRLTGDNPYIDYVNYKKLKLLSYNYKYKDYFYSQVPLRGTRCELLKLESLENLSKILIDKTNVDYLTYFFFRKELFDLKYNKQLLKLIIFGSLPLILFGYILHSSELIHLLRNIKLIAFTTLFFGVILYFSDQRETDQNISTNLSIKSILFIGLFQILALIPGVSRAGITITAARFLKFNRVDSGKISFLLSIPALAGASFLGLKDIQNEALEINLLVIIAIILSFMFSYVTVKFFLNYLNKFSLNIFVIYRLIIALILLSIIYF